MNHLLTPNQVIFKTLYPNAYTPTVSTRVSNSLLVGTLRIYVIYTTILTVPQAP